MGKKLSPQTGVNDVTAYLAGFLCLLVYAGSLLFPLMDKDAAHHANIALRMYEHNDYVSLVDRGNDYLDKPHFLFWSSLISFKIFGINTFAHRFPALLFALLSLFSTYKLALHLSNKYTARLATLMLATAQAFVLSVVDARMETPLTAGIIFGLWHLIVYIDRQKWINLILAALGAAMAFSTKGWLGPVIMFSAGFFHIVLQQKWRVFISPKTWVFIPLFFILISPVLYAYYLQYDLHPEKVIRGESNRSGIYFILWDQLFEQNNAQGETNIHNLVVDGVKLNKLIFTVILGVGMAIYLLLLPRLYRKNPSFRKLFNAYGIPIPQSYQVIAFALLAILTTLIPDGKNAEILESCVTLVFFLIIRFPANLDIYKPGSLPVDPGKH